MHTDNELDGEPDADDLVRISALSLSDLAEIDAALLEATRPQWRKVAYVVAMAMDALERRFVGVPDVFYAQRVALLAREGKIESAGNLGRMRYSEVRLPSGHEA